MRFKALGADDARDRLVDARRRIKGGIQIYSSTSHYQSVTDKMRAAIAEIDAALVQLILTKDPPETDNG
jgi:hypothetical protein